MEIQMKIAEFHGDNDNENTTYQNLARVDVKGYTEP